MRRVLLSAAGAALLHSTACSPAVLASMPDVEDDLYDEDLPGIDESPQYAYGDGDSFYGDGDEDPERWAERARALFTRLDTDGDGRVAAAELRTGLGELVRSYHARAHASSMAEVENVLAAADMDEDGVLTAAEFAGARTLYVHLEMHLPRAELFAFADSSADGRVDTAELASLIFPEYTGRADELRAFLTETALAAHDADSDARMSKEELRAFHARSNAAAGEGGGAGDAVDDDSAEHQRWVEHGGHYGGGWEDYDATAGGETFDWHDADGDGSLDAAELGEYMLPQAELLQKGYVDDEVAHLMRMLRGTEGPSHGEGGEPLQDAGGEGRVGHDDYDESESFDLNAVLALAREFTASFDYFDELFDEDGDVGDREEL